MCYNVQFMEKRAQKYEDRFKAVLPANQETHVLNGELPRYYFVSGFSHPQLPIVKHDGIFLFEWGLIPAWIKDPAGAAEIQNKTLNAVGETVFEKPSFKKSIASQRCLLGVSGFYEWRDFQKAKYPHLIQVKDQDIFSLGCIYETWVDKSTGELRNTFSILTTPANPMMEKIHNLKKRMPLILKPEDEQKWIEPGLSKAEIEALIKPFDEAEMRAFTVSKEVNNARFDRNTEQAIERVDYPELT